MLVRGADAPYGNGPPCGLSFQHPRPFGFSGLYTHAPAARRRPGQQGVGDPEWAKEAEENIPYIEHWRLPRGPPGAKQQENSAERGLNSSRISLCSCWRSLTGLISMLRPLLCETPRWCWSIFSITLSSRLDELQDGGLLVGVCGKQHSLLG